MDLKQLTPTQLAVGAGLLVLLLVLLLLLWLLGRSRGKARRRRERTAAALSDAPTAALAAPPTEPTPTQPPAIPPPPGPVRPPPGSGSESGSGAGRPDRADQPGEAGLTMFGSTPQSRGPYRVVQYPGDANQRRTAEPHPNDRLAAEQQGHRYSTPPQPRASMELASDQPEQTRDSAADSGRDEGPDFIPGFGGGAEAGSGSDIRQAAVGWPRSGTAARESGAGTGGDDAADDADRAGRGPGSPPDRPADPDRASDPEREPTSTPVPLPAGHPERNGLAAVPEPGEGNEPEPGEGNEPNGLTGDAKDRLLRVLLADPDRALHAVGDLEGSRNELDRLNDSVHYQRRQLADAARRLRGAGLTPAQVAQLAGFGEGELVSLLSEHTPSPTPRPSAKPPDH